MENRGEARTTLTIQQNTAAIELLEAPRPRHISSEGADNRRPVAMTSSNSISAAKLLENVEKSYDKGKLIRKESENTVCQSYKDTSVRKYAPKSLVVWKNMLTFARKPIF